MFAGGLFAEIFFFRQQARFTPRNGELGLRRRRVAGGVAKSEAFRTLKISA